MDQQSPAPKGQQAKHNAARAAAPASPAKSNSEGQPRNKGHKPRAPKKSHQQPVWEASDPTIASEGSFDANGTFISGHVAGVSSHGHVPNARKIQKNGSNYDNDAYISSDHRPSSSRQSQASNAVRAGAAATPIKSTAYAGPTFHASPAASALPMPKFFSKSVPTAIDSGDTSLEARMARESVETQQNASLALSSALQHRPSSAVPKREESPLDLFFRADREERARTASSNRPVTPRGLQLPVAQSAPPQANMVNWQNFHSSEGRHHSRQASSSSAHGVFPLELDGASVQHTPKAAWQMQDTVASAPPGSRQRQDDTLKTFLHTTAAFTGSPSPRQPPLHHRMPSGYSSDQPDSRHMQQRYVEGRSGPEPTTPASRYLGGGGQGQAFHYGNRNLSPMFHAARSDSASRVDALRRESPAIPQPVSPANAPANQHQSGYAQHPMSPVHAVAPLSAASNGNGMVQGPAASARFETMENDLRRILKLGGTDAA